MFQCRLCDYHVKRLDRYTEHYIAIHTDFNIHVVRAEKLKTEECNKCEKKFTNKCLLNRHVAQFHSKQIFHTCGTCKAGFIHHGKYRRHFLNNQKCKASCPKNFNYQICNICGEMFVFLSNLKHHIKWMHKKRNIECTICHKVLSCRESMERHLAETHNKSHQCTTCGKTFGSVRNLESHMRTHTGEKPHRCELCNVSFAQSGSLSNHKKSKGHTEKQVAKM
ncbi:unnamed protein product [Owenia fusiformis]|uniref:Uncharacterized protein n=1 Tax=Owenia fusiformis TaxID=6347 RepID=A0A8J1TZ14_OWEFU|nr:unnamed protein product [Owenia fusiformis]